MTEQKIETKLGVEIWYGRVRREADPLTGFGGVIDCFNGHRVHRGEVYFKLIDRSTRLDITLCLQACKGQVVEKLIEIAEARETFGKSEKGKGVKRG